jgi:dihydroorotase
MPDPERGRAVGPGLSVGRRVGLLEIGDAWLLDPATGREGVGAIRVEDGVVTEVRWRRGRSAEPPPILVTAGLADLHAHVREPAGTDVESTATALAAAARGGFTTLCLMANTQPPTDRPELVTRIVDTARASGSPVRALTHGAVTAGRAGAACWP